MSGPDEALSLRRERSKDSYRGLMQRAYGKSTTLAERAMACDGWEWRPGMRIAVAARGEANLQVYEVRNHVDGYQVLGCVEVGPDGHGQTIDVDGRNPLAVPDFSDGLTVLAVLLVLREAYGDSSACVVNGLRDGCLRVWRVVGLKIGLPLPAGASEAEALVYTLERAP